MKIILAGYMGSGKTAVGKTLARYNDLLFIDLDNEIENREKKTISQIFKENGEIYFRKREAEILKDLLQQDKNFVLSLGGGTPCYGKNLELIKNSPHTRLFYLKAGLFPLKERLLREKEQRPLIQHLSSPEVLEDFIRKHLFERTFYYNQSDYIINTDDRSIEEVVKEINALLN